jgi:Flp pilus assembly protein TadG
MADQSNAKKRSRFLSRLLRDQSGNTIAIMAAAVIPVLGLVGGAVDMGRIYLVKTRLQAACDAGSLMGRKAMGVGTWNAATHGDQAKKIFEMNFESGSYGSTGLVYSYTEDAGNVEGTAVATVPVTLMRPVLMMSRAKDEVKNVEQSLGREVTADERAALYKVFDQNTKNDVIAKTVTVECNADQTIPNTDMMFVLDVTGSMDGPASSSSSESRISGLKKATKCFYESIAKQDIDDVTPAQCGRTTNPSTGVAADVQLRFGFVPYAVNVNVGRLLPLNYMADNWTYQSREAVWSGGNGYDPVYGTESSRAPTGNPVSTGATGWSDWEELSDSVTINGYTYDNRFRSTSSQCAAVSAPPTQSGTTTGPFQLESQDPNPLAHPAPTLTRIYSQLVTNGQTEYRYVHYSSRCRLQARERTSSTTESYFRTTTPITWVPDRKFEGWEYKPVNFNISALKNQANNAWNNSITLPIGNNGTNRTVTWTGCIEERKTVRVNSTSPSWDNGDWKPIPTEAYDMQIDLLPNSADTKWAPIFNDVVYRRYNNDNSGTTGTVTQDENGNWTNSRYASGSNASCPVAARKFQSWTAANFKGYVNGLATGGNTYHDIGLLWGARLMSPSGIFASENAPPNKQVTRHMIFMTDGGTNVQLTDYSAYGINWWDRRQNGSGAPTKSWLDANLNARTRAICEAVKNKGITLWVVAFGDDIDTDTETRLSQCASESSYFKAESVADIVQKFNLIADKITALRLTN